jgi:HAD superfamily hydrolase (TIGR01509 family)
MYTLHKAILWDNDGVLVDTETLFFKDTVRAFEKLGIELTEDIWIRTYLGKGTGTHQIAVDMGADPDIVEEVLIERNRWYRRTLEKPPRIRTGVELTLKQLSGHLRLALVTGCSRRQLEQVHGHTTLLPYFELVVTEDDVEHAKPAPDLYLLAMKEMGLTPQDCLAVEDTSRGLAAARAAGLECIAAPTALTRAQDFTGALAVVDGVPDVLTYVQKS